MATNEITIKKIGINCYGEQVFENESKKIFSKWAEGKGYQYFKNRNVVCLYKNTNLKKIHRAEVGAMCILAMYANEDGALVNKKADCCVPMTDSEIAKILSLSTRQTIEVKKKLKENMLIKVDKYHNSTAIFINPIYFCSSKYISLTLFLVFKDELKSILPKWAYQRYMQWAIDLKSIKKEEC